MLPSAQGPPYLRRPFLFSLFGRFRCTALRSIKDAAARTRPTASVTAFFVFPVRPVSDALHRGAQKDAAIPHRPHRPKGIFQRTPHRRAAHPHKGKPSENRRRLQPHSTRPRYDFITILWSHSIALIMTSFSLLWGIGITLVVTLHPGIALPRRDFILPFMEHSIILIMTSFSLLWGIGITLVVTLHPGITPPPP